MASRLSGKIVKMLAIQARCNFVLSVRGAHLPGGTIRSKRLSPCVVDRIGKIASPGYVHVREVRLTRPRGVPHPLILLLFRPLAKATAILFGRRIRKWWKNLSPEEKEVIREKIRMKLHKIAIAGVFAFVIFIIYFLDHIKEAPITKRRRFMMVSEETMNMLSEMEYQSQMNTFKSYIVPKHHSFYQRTLRVINTLLLSNMDIPGVRNREWILVVVDRPDIVNAFTLPQGKIFVFTGILNMCSNDDQLAIVLSHEIAHTLLSHMAEGLSKIILVDMLLIIPSIICWAVFSDVWAVMTEGMTNALAKLLIHLPFSRSIEKEADFVGLQLAARSCYDVRQTPIFWSKMNQVTSTNDPVEWLSTHPSYETREADVNKLMPMALKLRDDSNCPALKQFFGLPNFDQKGR